MHARAHELIRGRAEIFLVGTQDWGSAAWCRLAPALLVFEWLHCAPATHRNATRALERAALCAAGRHGGPAAPYRLIGRTGENVFYARLPT